MPANLWKTCKFCGRDCYQEGPHCPFCKMRLDGTLEMSDPMKKDDCPPPIGPMSGS